MILTKSQLEHIRLLFKQQKFPDTFPDEAEYAFMLTISSKMSFDDYLALAPEEKKKWWINSAIIEARPLGLAGLFTDEELYYTGFYFEPVTPYILEREY